MNLGAILLDALAMLAATVLLMLLVGALSRRLLGVRMSAGRIVPFRAIATVEGTLRTLDPGFDFVSEAGGYARARMSEATSAGSIAKTFTDELLSALPIARPAGADRSDHRDPG